MGKTKNFNKDNLAVLLVDMQTGFLRNLPKREMRRIVGNQLIVLRRCNELLVPVVVMESVCADACSYETFIDYGETESSLMIEARRNSRCTLMTKESSDSFVETRLDDHLACLGAKSVFVMGIWTDHCIRLAVRSALASGYHVATSSDVISNMSAPGKRNNIGWSDNSNVALCSTKAFLENMS